MSRTGCKDCRLPPERHNADIPHPIHEPFHYALRPGQEIVLVTSRD
jgi:hypothetical protein